jgi:hypothetical protein
MPTYWYSETNKRTGAKKRRILYLESEGVDTMSAVFQDKLDAKREQRFRNILYDYAGSMDDAEAIRNFLPSEFKNYAENLDTLKAQMASMYEIQANYAFSDIEIAPNCYGCLHDCPGQRDHMECPSGCLHSPDTCFTCN